ncbi:hypothetical protein CWE09_04160 [Aliidiomarina minuta]|uniref:DUF1795 domain-containing protein n=1 Tax=Aliidiomarina minuta TaxID=880057 RepID=A0A432W774_9GAMM|nr:hypothetical protein [Aliidiomarina minuta]RUO25928.1 hypothetical protein CWE09_04160 [Aliidiomarina minuta]
MKLKSILLSTLFILSQPLLAADYNFEPPEFPEQTGGQIFQYYLPADNGFAANVNLQIQPFDGSLEEYEEISVSQFEQMDIEVLQLERTGNELLIEYRGAMQETDLHWYARVVKQDNLYYVLTATALAERWNEEQDALVNSVHSFQLTD